MDARETCGHRRAAISSAGAGFVECTFPKGHMVRHQYGQIILDGGQVDAERNCDSPVLWDGLHRHRCILKPGHAGPHKCQCP